MQYELQILFYKDEANCRETAFCGMMSLSDAEEIIKSAAEYASGSCTFLFQGGEPTLAGLDFYKGFAEIEKKYAKKGSYSTTAYRPTAF